MNQIVKPNIKLILSIIPTREKQYLILAISCQSILALLDLVGIFLVGLIGALSFSETGNVDLPEVLTVFVSLEGKSTRSLIFILGSSAIFVLTTRTLLSALITKKMISYLTNRGAQLSSILVSKFLVGSILKIQMQVRQSLLFSLTRGVELVYINILAALVVAASEISLLIILSLGLLFYNASAAFVILVFFGSFTVGVYLYLYKRVHKTGTEAAKLGVESEEQINEAFNAYRQIAISGRMNFFSTEISQKRQLLASKMAVLYFSSHISKYAIDLAVVSGMALIGISLLRNSDADGAIQSVGVFLAAGIRIFPSILRVQQNLVQVQSSLGSAKSTLDILLEQQKLGLPDSKIYDTDFVHEGFNSDLIVNNVFFKYPPSASGGLNGVTFSVKPGMKVAVVGLSGSGKSTLADLILGILTPDNGEIQISGLSIDKALKKWPGAIAYVPQEVAIFGRTYWDNITLGAAKTSLSEINYDAAIRAAGLEDLIGKSSINSETSLLHNGANLSGGERQRIGIARALFTKPKFLVLDEATSSLDSHNESYILDLIRNKNEDLTILMIAHRLYTLRDADMIIYLSNGKVMQAGSFDNVRKTTPEFDKQLKNMGL